MGLPFGLGKNIKLLKEKNLYSLFENFFSFFLLKGLNFLIPLITLPFLLTKLDPATFGLIVFAESLIFYFQSFTDYGFNLSGTRDISKNIDNASKINQAFNEIMFGKVLLSIFGFFILLIFLFISEKLGRNKDIFIVTYFIVIGQAITPMWFYQGIEKMRFIALFNLFSRILFLILLFSLIKSNDDYFLVPVINAISYCSIGLISMVFTIHHFKIVLKPNFKAIFNRLKTDFNIFISSITPTLYNNTSTFLLGVIAGSVVLGQYSAANKIIEVTNVIIYTISSVIYPFLNRRFEFHTKFAVATIAIASFLSICLFILSFYLANIFGPDYKNSEALLRFMSINPLLLAIICMYGSNYLLIKNQDKIVKNITIVCSIFGIIVAFLTIPIFGYWGAAITLTFSRACLGGFYFMFHLKLKRNEARIHQTQLSQ